MKFLADESHKKAAMAAGFDGRGMSRGQVAQKIAKGLRTHVRSSPRFKPRTQCITFPIKRPEGDTGYVGLTIEGQKDALKYMSEPDKKVLVADNPHPALREASLTPELVSRCLCVTARLYLQGM